MLQVLEQLGLYIATVVAGLAIHGLIVLPMIYLVIVKKNPFTYIYGVLQVFFMDRINFTRPVSSVVTTLLSVKEVWGSIPGLVKSDTVSPTARHRCDASSELCYSGAKPRRWIPPLVTCFGVIPRV